MSNTKLNFMVDIVIFVLFVAMIVSGYMMGNGHGGRPTSSGTAKVPIVKA